MNFSMFPKRVLVRVDPLPEVSKGGIITPDFGGKKSVTGEVISIGRDCTVQIGERVMFSRFASRQIEEDGTILMILDEEQIFATISDDVKEVVVTLER